VIRATIDSFVFNDLVKKVRIGKTGEAYILNTEGVLQTDRRSGGNLMAKPSENLSIPESKLDIQTFTQKNESGCWWYGWKKLMRSAIFIPHFI